MRADEPAKRLNFRMRQAGAPVEGQHYVRLATPVVGITPVAVEMLEAR